METVKSMFYLEIEMSVSGGKSLIGLNLTLWHGKIKIPSKVTQRDYARGFVNVQYHSSFE